jgi:hypothetical protein
MLTMSKSAFNRIVVLLPSVSVLVLLVAGTATRLNAASHPKPEQTEAPAQTSRSNEANSTLKTDLERMRILVGQMQRNVAFVTAGDTPLKHQFELEIEMWQLLIRDMEKKMNAAEKPTSP